MALATKIYRVFGARFRKRRMEWLVREFSDCQSILDIGGEAPTWQDFRPSNLTLLNVGTRPLDLEASVSYLQGDGRALPAADGAFDLAYSNSVIEHVGSLEDQRRFAQEMQRVGRRVYCQTPNKWFPLETHSLGLLLHWLPGAWQSPVFYRYLTLQGWRIKPTRQECMACIRSVRHLTRRELAAMFPGCHIRTERFLGLPKSFIAWR
jgi:hypothetical protein